MFTVLVSNICFHLIGVRYIDTYLVSPYWCCIFVSPDRPRAITISTLDFDSSVRGSHPRGASNWYWIFVFTLLVMDICVHHIGDGYLCSPYW